MALARWELEQRQRGNVAGAEKARILLEQYGDVEQTPEASVKIKRFSKEQREALEKQGYVIYGLTGESIKTLSDKGRGFYTTWHQWFPDCESLGSMQSDVAINPDRLYLTESNNKTLLQQVIMVEEFSQELGKKIQGVKAIIGQVPDYIELLFQHLDATQDYLFGEKYNYGHTRTRNKLAGFAETAVGYSRTDIRPNLTGWDSNGRFSNLFIAPLVVPV